MAGGRPRKLTEAHKAAGSYREDRHGGGLDALIGSSLPRKPQGLDGDASEFWDLVVSALPSEAMSVLDTALLYQLARWHSVWLWNDEVLRMDPSDRDAMKAALSASQQCFRIASQFGLTPADRAKIKSGDRKADDDPLMLLANLKAPSEN